MTLMKSLLAASLAVSCLLGDFASAPPGGHQGQLSARLALLQLQSDFHAANTLGDQALMESIWAEDGSFTNPGGTIQGRSAVVAFFMGGQYWGTAANLVPSYKTQMDIHGNTATMRFECVVVDCGGADPTTEPLSTIPFGAQNPGVQIVQHSNATIEAVKSGDHWVIQSFTGGAGAILP